MLQEAAALDGGGGGGVIGVKRVIVGGLSQGRAATLHVFLN